MAAGLNAQLTKVSVDQTVGDASQQLNIAFENVASTKRFLDPAQDADLEALGYTPADIANIRSAFSDLDQLRRIFEGLEALAAPKDFRVFAQRLWGTGFISGR